MISSNKMAQQLLKISPVIKKKKIELTLWTAEMCLSDHRIVHLPIAVCLNTLTWMQN